MVLSGLPVLLVDDEKQALMVCEVALRFAGIKDVVCCEDSRKVAGLLATQPFGCVMLDLTMPGISGEELLPVIKRDYPELPVIVLTGANDVTTAVRCMRAGAFDYMVKPVEDSRLVSGVKRALEIRQLQMENSLLGRRLQSDDLEHPEHFADIVTQDPKMFALFRYAETVAKTDRPVLITGDTGVGKELVAKALHNASGRTGQYVAINVAGLDDSMFSDTLFGHVKGAFTSADDVRRGLIEQASAGSLFLDEIGDLSNPSQVKLLRLLQEREYLPLGADTPMHSDARLILATNQDLMQLQQEGRFRRDLYYRLQTHHIHVPALSARMDDLEILLEHFLKQAAKALDKRKPTPPRELLQLLGTYHFPGNVRELEAMVFEAVSHHQGGVLSMDMFKEYLDAHGGGPRNGEAIADQEPAESMLQIPGGFPSLKDAGDFLVREAMERAKGNQTIAARLLGISRPALSKRLKRQERDENA